MSIPSSDMTQFTRPAHLLSFWLGFMDLNRGLIYIHLLKKVVDKYFILKFTHHNFFFLCFAFPDSFEDKYQEYILHSPNTVVWEKLGYLLNFSVSQLQNNCPC